MLQLHKRLIASVSSQLQTRRRAQQQRTVAVVIVLSRLVTAAGDRPVLVFVGTWLQAVEAGVAPGAAVTPGQMLGQGEAEQHHVAVTSAPTYPCRDFHVARHRHFTGALTATVTAHAPSAEVVFTW